MKEPPSAEEVEKLLGFSDPTAGSDVSLCSFTFADLRRTGTLSLIVSSDLGGVSCGYIEIVDPGFEHAGLSTFAVGHGENVQNLIKDIAGDGRHEIVVKTVIGGYQENARCGLEWPVIFAWTGASYAAVSGQFKDYYRQRLAALKRQIAASPPSAPERPKTPVSQPTEARGLTAPTLAIPQSQKHYDMDCLKAEAAKTERFLGISNDAGMVDAIKWSKSNDPLTREFAANVFADIKTPEAINRLKILASDSGSEVAAFAKARLYYALHEGPIRSYDTVVTEPLAIPDN